jgi:hypothetical protein
MHTFKHVMGPETSQNTIFDRVGMPLVDDLLSGKNGMQWLRTVPQVSHEMQCTLNPSLESEPNSSLVPALGRQLAVHVLS